MSEPTIHKQFPTLFHIDSRKNTRQWTCYCIQIGDQYFIRVEHGIKNGKLICNDREIKEGKNIGKKNETSILEQTIKQAERLVKDKQEKDLYVQQDPSVNNNTVSLSSLSLSKNKTKEGEGKKVTFESQEKTVVEDTKIGPFLPMLADKFDPESKKNKKVDIVFPCLIQPKLDGIRCITYFKDIIKKDSCMNQSRTCNTFFHMDHINKECLSFFRFFQNMKWKETHCISDSCILVLDGELYNHSISFNQITGIVRKEKCNKEDLEKCKQIEYHIYDCFIYDTIAKTICFI